MIMNVLFLTMVNVDVNNRGIYNDLMRKFRNEGHQVYILCPVERRIGKKTYLTKEDNVFTLHVRTLNLQKTNIIEKGIGQLLLEPTFKIALKRYFGEVRFDLILYSTPPITFNNVIQYAKSSSGNNALSYLMLKDIFPQNALDMGMLRKTGVKGFLYRMFRRKEEKLYALSDVIGCMSPANVRFLIEHNPQVNPDKVEICPNSVELIEEDSETPLRRNEIRSKYNLPLDKPIFIYGGNLGIPQGIPFLIDCLEANANRDDCHFVVVGSGTFYQMLENWYNKRKPKAITLLSGLPKADYDQLVQVCDVGLIFLDYRFTIPNFPSRLLSYLEYKMPVIACTDPNCDTGTIAEDNGFGFYSPSNDVQAFTDTVNRMLNSDMNEMGEKGYEFLKRNYLVENSYDAIMKHLK